MTANNDLHGHVSAGFEGVATVVRDQLRAGAEVGVSLVADLDGERVVDLWGGHRDADRTQPWSRDTITNVWSITKTVTSLAALRLVDSGELDVTAPVAHYWPEFAAAGKDGVEVRHLLSHTSGLSGVDQPVDLVDLYDTRGTAARLAAQAPWWRPGTASGYHVLTYGHLVGELVHRISGRSLRDFITQELATPLGADFGLGVAAGDLDRVADVIAPPTVFDPAVLPASSVAYRTFTGPSFDATVANTSAWRRADLGAANGHGNAASVADLLAPLTGRGETSRGRFLSSTTVDLVLEQQSDGIDLVNGLDLRWGIGYALPKPGTLPWLPLGRVAFWGGWGGSMAIADLDRRLTIAYVMNGMGDDILGSPRAEAYVRAVYAAIGAEPAGPGAGG